MSTQPKLMDEKKYNEQILDSLGGNFKHSVEIAEKLHKLLVYNPSLIDENKHDVPESVQKELIYQMGAIVGEYYRNDNCNVSEHFEFYQQSWMNIWDSLVGSSRELARYEGIELDEDGQEEEVEPLILEGKRVFEEPVLEEIKRDLWAIEVNMVLGLSYNFSKKDIAEQVSRILGDSSEDALMRAYYRIEARIADWCRANPAMLSSSWSGEKVEGEFAEKYRQIILGE